MVHQVLADARQVRDRLDPQLRQLIRRTDAAPQEDRRTHDRPRGEHDLPSPHLLQLPVALDPQPHRAAVLDQHAVDEAVAADGEVEPVAGGREEAEVGRPARHLAGAAAVHRRPRDARRLRVVLIAVLLEARRQAGVVEPLLHRSQLLARPATHGNGTALAVEVAAFVPVVLDRAEVGEALLPAPALVAGHLRPAVVVARRPADGDPRVDGGRTSDQLPPRQRRHASRHECRVEPPVVVNRRGLVDAVHVVRERLKRRVVWTGVEQEHRPRPVLTQPRGEDCSGRPRPHDDDVVLHQPCPSATAASMRAISSASSGPFASASRHSESSARFFTPRITVAMPSIERV